MQEIFAAVFRDVFGSVFPSPSEPPSSGLSGRLTASGSVVGSIAVTRYLSGTLSASSSLTGNLTVSKMLSGNLSASGSVTGNLTVGTTEYVNSVQYVEVDMTGVSSNTATISAVGSKAFILWSGTTSTTQQARGSLCHAAITNSTTITVTRNVDGSGTAIWSGYVVDATDALVDSVEILDVTTTSGGTTGTQATSGTFPLSQSTVNIIGMKSAISNTSAGINGYPAIYLSGTQQITWEKQATGDSTSWALSAQVIKWNSAALASNVQQVYINQTSTDASQAATITSVTPANTIMLWGGGGSAASATRTSGFVSGELTNATTVTAYNGSGGTWFFRAPVVEFVSGVLASAQNVVETGLVSVVFTATETLGTTLASTTKATIHTMGNDTASISSAGWRKVPRMQITNTTTVTSTVGDDLELTDAYNNRARVVEWN